MRVSDVDIFAAIAHPVRRDILDRLSEQSASAQELAAPYAVSRSAVSQHLAILRESGLVSRERHGRNQIYQLQANNLTEVFNWVSRYEKFWNQKLDALGDYLNETAGSDDVFTVVERGDM